MKSQRKRSDTFQQIKTKQLKIILNKWNVFQGRNKDSGNLSNPVFNTQVCKS